MPINIKKIRKSKGMSQKQLAEKLKVSQSAVSQFENSDTLSIGTIMKISDALGVELHELLGYDPDLRSLDFLLNENVLNNDEELLLHDFRCLRNKYCEIILNLTYSLKWHSAGFEQNENNSEKASPEYLFPNLSIEDYNKICEYIDYLSFLNFKNGKYYINAGYDSKKDCAPYEDTREHWIEYYTKRFSSSYYKSTQTENCSENNNK